MKPQEKVARAFTSFVCVMILNTLSGNAIADKELAVPMVYEYVTPCNSSLVVTNLYEGATVEVYSYTNNVSLNKLVAEDTVKWPTQSLELLEGVTLEPGQKLVARQEHTQEGIQSSFPSLVPPVIVGEEKAPDGVMYSMPVYTCGTCVNLYELVPCATTELNVDNKAGPTFVSPYINALVGLGDPMVSHLDMEARQTGCGFPPPPGFTPIEIEPFPLTNKIIPPPEVKGPLVACQESLTVTGISPGALVTVTRSKLGAAPYTFRSHGDDMILYVAELELGEYIKAKQEYPACECWSGQSSQQVTESRPDPPIIVPPLCSGMVKILNVLPLAEVEVIVGKESDNMSVKTSAGLDEATVNLPVGTQPGMLLRARQKACSGGQWSDLSPSASVGSLPLFPGQPHIPGHLYECADVVRVEGLEPGAYLEVWSQNRTAPIGRVDYVSAEVMDVPVWPDLDAGYKVWALQSACGLLCKSNEVPVNNLPALTTPPEVVSAYTYMHAVPVAQVLPGAVVDVYVSQYVTVGPWEWRGRAISGGTEVEVPLMMILGELQEDEFVWARMWVCNPQMKIDSAFAFQVQQEYALDFLSESEIQEVVQQHLPQWSADVPTGSGGSYGDAILSTCSINVTPPGGFSIDGACNTMIWQGVSEPCPDGLGGQYPPEYGDPWSPSYPCFPYMETVDSEPFEYNVSIAVVGKHFVANVSEITPHCTLPDGDTVNVSELEAHLNDWLWDLHEGQKSNYPAYVKIEAFSAGVHQFGPELDLKLTYKVLP
jgi:hypothetical protein